MTTARKVVLIIATALVIGGCAISFGAFAAADFRLENLSNMPRDWTEVTETLDAESVAAHNAIIVDSEAGDVRFEASSSDAIEVTYWKSELRNTEITNTNGELHITCTSKPRIGVMIMDFDFTDRSTVVKVPASFAGSVTVRSHEGSTTIDDMPSLSAVSVTTNNGHAHIGRSTADSVELRTENGVVDINDVTANSVEAFTRNGSVQMAFIEAAGAVTAQGGNGNISVNDLRAATLSVFAESGSIELRGIDADTVETRSQTGNQHLNDVSTGRLTAQSMQGSIDGTALVARDGASVQADTGEVSLSFTGSADDYAIDASSAAGNVRAPQGSPSATKRIVIRTTIGNIDLYLSESPSASQDMEASGGGNGTGVPSAPVPPTAPEAPKAPSAPMA